MESQTPPTDDVCPICHDDFYVPCMTNCGHWFCGNCILLCWKHRPSIEQCRCPICSQPVSKLIPEASFLSKQDEEIAEICKNIQQYNFLYAGGIRGLFVKFRGLPLYLQRISDQLLDVDRYYANFQRLRFIILIFGLLYKLSCVGSLVFGDVSLMIRFLNFHNWIDIGSYVVLGIVFLIGAWRKRSIRRRQMAFIANAMQEL